MKFIVLHVDKKGNILEIDKVDFIAEKNNEIKRRSATRRHGKQTTLANLIKKIA